jgi:hypothetical protein
VEPRRPPMCSRLLTGPSPEAAGSCPFMLVVLGGGGGGGDAA